VKSLRSIISECSMSEFPWYVSGLFAVKDFCRCLYRPPASQKDCERSRYKISFTSLFCNAIVRAKEVIVTSDHRGYSNKRPLSKAQLETRAT
jgi:hypothetical protein